MSLKKTILGLARRLGISHRLNDLDEELQFHLQKEIEQNVAAGMSPAEARRRALISLGGVQQTREAVKQVYWTHLWDVLLQDIRYGWRMLRKSSALSLICILILALGIGMNTAIFSLIDAVLYRALPAQDAQNLLLLRWNAHNRAESLSVTDSGDCPNVNSKVSPSGCIFSLPFFRAAQTQTDILSSVAAFAAAPEIALSGNGPATILNSGELVSGNFFQALGVDAAAGRTLGPADDTPTASPAMMLSYGYWQAAFGGDPSVVGRTVRLNGFPFTIVGVIKRGFEALTPARRFDIWLPLSVRARLTPDWTPRDDQEDSWWLVVVGRLKAGVSPAQAQAAVSLLYRNYTVYGNKPVFQAADEPGIAFVSAQQGLDGSRDQFLQPLYVLLLAVGLVLLIACANVAGLLLARSASRQREIAVRLTLGARRSRVLFQLLLESLMLSLMGGMAGILVGHWAARAMVALVNKAADEGVAVAPRLDVRVLMFTAAVSMLTGIIFGLLPAFRSLRFDLTPALKSGGAGSAGSGSRNRWYSLGNSLVVAQITLAMIALVVAGLLVHSLRSLRNVDLGFEPRNVLLFGIDPTLAGYKDAQADALYRELQEKFAALPVVASVSYSWRPLLSGGLWTTDFHPHGASESESAPTDYMPVGPGFFKTMGIPMQAGRDFSQSDFDISAATVAARKANKPVPDAVPVPVIVNETFVKKYLVNLEPVGQYIEPTASTDTTQPRHPGWQIVGVVRDAKYNRARREISPTIYAPNSGGGVFFELRTKLDPKSLIASVRDLVSHRDSNLALFHVNTELEEVDNSLVVERVLANLSSVFGLLALALACIGLYGLLSYEVGQRTREIGIRMAVGAQQHNVIGMVVRQALALAAVGAAIGLAASFGISRILGSFLYGVRSGDPITLVAVSGFLLLVALAACYPPARRATRIDPLIALRYE